jgi:hypothetical protein
MSLLQDFEPRIHMAHSDFVSITKNGELCDEDGQVRWTRWVLERKIILCIQSNTLYRPLTILTDPELFSNHL